MHYSLNMNASNKSEFTAASNVDEEDSVYLTADGSRPSTNNFGKYVVSIRHRDKFNYEYNKYFGATHFCGGSILSPELILTAAHCIKRSGRRLRPSTLEVVTSTPMRLVRTTDTQAIDVSHVAVHSKFDGHRPYFDIALLKLRSKIDLDGIYAEAIPLPRGPPVVGAACTTPGWGRLYWDGPYANEILFLNLRVMNSSYCRHKFSIVVYGQICVFDPNDDDKSACIGYSGGPLICNGSVTGIVSYGYKCDAGLPILYTDVYQYLDWIIISKCGKLEASLWKLQLLTVLWTTIFSR